MAVGLEHPHDGALGRQAGRCLGVGDRQWLRARACLQRERPLSGRGDEVEWLRAGGAAEAAKARECEHGGVDLAIGELAQARVDVATQFDDLDVVVDRKQLRPAAQ